MAAYGIFKDLAIILIFAKLFGILARKCKAPQVVGEIIAGLLMSRYCQLAHKYHLQCDYLLPL